MSSIIEDIKDLCKEVREEAEFLEYLAGSAGRSRWPAVDPGLAKLKEMARIQAGIVLAKAQALKDLIPE